MSIGEKSVREVNWLEKEDFLYVKESVGDGKDKKLLKYKELVLTGRNVDFIKHNFLASLTKSNLF